MRNRMVASGEATGKADIVPAEPPKEDDTEPCRHLGPRGCGLPRWQRPYRCTWYFCDALLQRMPSCDPRGYRAFVDRLKALGELLRRVETAE